MFSDLSGSISRPSFAQHATSAADSLPTFSRQRAIRACQLCRTRRIKCDNGQPKCSACVKSGSECLQISIDRTTVIDGGTLKILQRIDDLENVIKSLLQPSTKPSNKALKARVDREKRFCLTTEELLSWRVFEGHYGGRHNLKALLQNAQTSQTIPSPSSVDPSSLMASEAESASSRSLLDRFFHFVHVKNPMLDEPKIRQMVHRLSLDGPSWDAESCLGLLVLAIGSITSSFDAFTVNELDAQSILISQSYFTAAQRRIGTISGRGGVLEAQCHFYSGVYLMTRLHPLRAWRYFTQGLACCQEFACANPVYYEHSTDHVPAWVALPAEESVYWSCWKSERELRSYLDLPDFTSDNLSYPLNFPTPPISMAEDHATSWYFYLSEISLIRLEHRVRDEIKNVLTSDEATLVEDLAKSTRIVEALAEEWIQTLPPAMNLFTPQEEDDVLKFILRGHFLDLWEIVYWPWLEIYINRNLHGPEVNAYVSKGFQIGIDRLRINKPGFYHCHHGTWLMVQSCTRSALSLLAAKHSVAGAALLPPGWQDAVFDAMNLLRFWQKDVPDAADRLQILEELSGNLLY